ncbi:DUF2771 domain-containing protein [Streptomyces sp. A7024]|uniref:DUF2771 domain-containing protein n=1 Tax=Streptomyces coryli TaxID=1128680 RepID=A0A6G4UBW7_9ACTN|nr:DUF2771 domain-containing protein [Streptomyces coryli]NGN69633.1 DUF2771 domain-containing protein [Streptomyces coryli]
MTIAFSPGRRRRAAAALGAAAVSIAALAACEKPTPLATLTVGSDTVTTEAECYKKGEVIPQNELSKCLEESSGKSVSLGPGDKLRIGVDPKIAETGWVMFVNGQPAITEPSDRTYISFQGDAFFQGAQGPDGQQQQVKQAKVAIVEVDGGSSKGVWSFDLKKK